MFHDVWWDPLDGDPHVLELHHWGAEVKVFNVYVHVFRAGGGDDAVEVEFYSWEIGGGSGDFAYGDEFVAADGESDAIHVGFVGFEGCDDAEIGGNTARWLVGVSDEPHGVGSGGGVREATLSEAANFEGGSVHPFDGVCSLE